MSAKLRRVVLLVADGLGIGEAPDAKAYGDVGSNTLGNLSEAVGGLKLPTLQRLGLGNLGSFKGIPPSENPSACVARMCEQSEGKDTTTGHWELAGLITHKSFAAFPKGFPDSLIQALVEQAHLPGILGNKAASGTTIITELGEEHLRTGKPIVYTSADSVFQVAAHEGTFGLERLYEICHIARELTLPYRIGRVIARPFIGKTASDFKRTEHRRDYAISPGRNCLDVLSEQGISVCSVGKIDDIFNHRGISRTNHTGNNRDSYGATLDFLAKSRSERALIFTNLVDFDMLYGHRRDPEGYAKALVDLDLFLPNLFAELSEDACVILTADHGCDPTFSGSDHTREYVPMIAYSPGGQGGRIGDRSSFADVSAFLLEGFGISPSSLKEPGKSFLCHLKRSS